MHYCALVLIPALGDVKDCVTGAMAPHREVYGPEDAEGERSKVGFWDFWQVGGRYCGFFDGHDPATDIRNHERCMHCPEKPGQRFWDGKGWMPCNGCAMSEEDKKLPLGICVSWPTQWVLHEGDCQPCPYDIGEHGCYTLILANGTAHHRKVYNPEGPDHFPKTPGFDELVKASLLAHTGRVVVVDYHS